MPLDGTMLVLRRATGHRGGVEWSTDDCDVCDGERTVGRIFRDANGAWFWGLGFPAQQGGKKHYGTVESREAAMAAFKAEYERWQREH